MEKRKIKLKKPNIMIKFLVIICLFYTKIVISQVRLNYAKSEIVSEFSDNKFKLKEFKYNGLDAVAIFTVRVNLLYLFNTSKSSIMNILIPHTQEDLKHFIELYNKEYVIISDTEWKMYSKNNVATIELIYSQAQGKPTIRWILID